MDLNSALAFSKIIQSGSFTAASKALNIPKSTLSLKIAELESDLGVQLIYRTTRKIHLTEAGQAFLLKINDALQLFQQAEKTASEQQSSPAGTLKITAPIELGSTLMQEALRLYLRRYPDVKIDLELSDRLVDLVGEGFDLAIRAGSLDDSALKAQKLGQSRFILVASPKLLKEHSSFNSIEQLRSMPCLHFNLLNKQPLWELTRGKESLKLPVLVNVSTNHLGVLKELCIQSVGVALLPEFYISDEIKKKKLIHLFKDWISEPAPIHIIYAASRFVSPKIENMIHILKETSAQLNLIQPSKS